MSTDALRAAIEQLNNKMSTLIEMTREQILLQRVLTASTDIGMEWDAYEVWCAPHGEQTVIVPVELAGSTKDIVVVKIHNHDLLGANMVYYSRDPRPNLISFGGLFYRVTIPRTLYLDFDVGGGELNAPVTAGSKTGDELAAELQASVNNVAGADVVAIAYNDGTKRFDIQFDSTVVPSATLLFGTGTNVATGDILFEEIGFTGASDRAGGFLYTSDVMRVTDMTTSGRKRLTTPFPLVPGAEGGATIVLAGESLYGFTDPNCQFQVPVEVRRARVR